MLLYYLAVRKPLQHIENNDIEGLESELTLNNRSLDIHLKYDENEYDTGPRQPE